MREGKKGRKKERKEGRKGRKEERKKEERKKGRKKGWGMHAMLYPDLNSGKKLAPSSLAAGRGGMMFEPFRRKSLAVVVIVAGGE